MFIEAMLLLFLGNERSLFFIISVFPYSDFHRMRRAFARAQQVCLVPAILSADDIAKVN
jgi:hypothetical protein